MAKLSEFPALQSIRQNFNQVQAFACSLLVISSFTWGFDNQGFATIQAMDSFKERFGDYNPETKTWAIPTQFLSYLNSFQYIGFAFGLFVGSYVSNTFGRKWSIRVMSVYALITATITITSKRREQILAARVLNYVFVGMEAATIPVFQAEITPKRARALMVGAFQLALNLGGLIVHIITNATAKNHNDSAWRIPVGLFYVCPSIIVVLINFVPESPRWLVLKGRHEEALESLRRLRQGKFTPEEIEDQYAEITAAVKDGESQQSSWFELFQGTNLKRTTICVFVNIFQQVTGQAFASQYGVLFIQSLGTVNAFQMSIGSSVVGIGFVLICLLFADKVGRKSLVEAGSLLQIFGLFFMAGLGTQSPILTSAKNGIVAGMFIFGAGFALGWAPLTYVMITEIPTARLRDKTQTFGFFFNILFAFLIAFTLPYLLNDGYAGLHSRVGFIYGSFSILALLFVVFFVPECQGRSLEEVDYMFENHVPVRHFHKYDVPKIAVYLESAEEYQEIQVTNLDHKV